MIQSFLTLTLWDRQLSQITSPWSIVSHFSVPPNTSFCCTVHLSQAGIRLFKQVPFPRTCEHLYYCVLILILPNAWTVSSSSYRENSQLYTKIVNKTQIPFLLELGVFLKQKLTKCLLNWISHSKNGTHLNTEGFLELFFSQSSKSGSSALPLKFTK